MKQVYGTSFLDLSHTTGMAYKAHPVGTPLTTDYLVYVGAHATRENVGQLTAFSFFFAF